ncbi:hypothetical protein N6H14_23130 [Paenibacillus sp. CC-CFT747]|nr:hypothetical protein N6H14_23130 [Paenibacillus sp. CC-CFT747]
MAKRKQAIILLIIAALSVLLIWQLSGSSGIRPQATSGGKDNGSALNGKKKREHPGKRSKRRYQ